MSHELLTVAQMYAADAIAEDHGAAALDLMERAGQAVAAAIAGRWPGGRVLVACGPGNNGGDGFVAARALAGRGVAVRVALLGERDGLKGDAASMAARWSGPVEPLSPATLDGAEVVVDGLFGAGLTRPLEGVARQFADALNASAKPVLAIDVPSGLSGDSGLPVGEACVRALVTVTFFRKKPGHVLMPGRLLCGDILVADIGIPEAAAQDASLFENLPPLWQGKFPAPDALSHKYDRGHALVVSGPAHATGAARLAARGALRIGAGLVSVASPLDAVAVNAGSLTAIMVKPFDGTDALAGLIADPRFKAFLIGPGTGLGDHMQAMVETILAAGRPAVLDADALTAFAAEPDSLFAMLDGQTVLTPHEGEFDRLFHGLRRRAHGKIDAAVQAARQARAVVLLKGPDTVIAAPDGRAAVNTNAPATLATAGSGDVLAGLITGLLAQGMPVFEAACAGAWLHGEAARLFGPGLIAEDLPEMVPAVLRGIDGG